LNDVSNQLFAYQLTSFDNPQPYRRLVQFLKNYSQLMNKISLAFRASRLTVIGCRWGSGPQYLPGDVPACGRSW